MSNCQPFLDKLIDKYEVHLLSTHFARWGKPCFLKVVSLEIVSLGNLLHLELFRSSSNLQIIYLQSHYNKLRSILFMKIYRQIGSLYKPSFNKYSLRWLYNMHSNCFKPYKDLYNLIEQTSRECKLHADISNPSRFYICPYQASIQIGDSYTI